MSEGAPERLLPRILVLARALPGGTEHRCVPAGGSWVVVGSIGAFTLLGWLLFIASSGAARRVVMLGLASLVGYALARIAPPACLVAFSKSL